ncbi:LuxR C-terminal-related transcriptional regulator [Solimonas soli]|uniref:LuxR C-terminal-related transcriptional regulator n=1 Tax=Solimonas soli TaxID=413479 RepID=UPI000484BC1C|nr:LuxR C-terminal-related transcriptional regulator [Solimonas soli]
MSNRAARSFQRSSEAKAFLPRPGLVDAALPDGGRGLLVLAAPAGYGKTWLARQLAQVWSERNPERVRVWTLHSATSLTQALRSFCELCGHAGMPASLNPDVAADTALEAMSQCPGGLGTLIVDMDGAPPGHAVKSLVRQILLEFCTQGRAVLACRNPHVLPLERIAMFAPVQRYGSAELAFGVDEIAAAQALGRDAALRWMELTEGWPLACGQRSAAFADATPDDLVARLAEHRADYFEHELLAALPARDQRLLMQAAVLDAVEPGMLEALDATASLPRLFGLVEDGLPVSARWTDHDRVVLHPVLRAFLLRRLRVQAPALHQAAQRRAAEACADAGNYRQALAHARRTGDPSFAAQITERSGGWRVIWHDGLRALDGGAPNIAGLAERFPAAILARIYWQAQTGRVDEAQRALDAVRAHQTPASLHVDLAVIATVVDVYRDRPFAEESLAQLEQRAGDAAASEAPLLAPSAAAVACAVLNNAGLYERTLPSARAAILEAEALDSAYVELYGRWQCALALHGLGRVGEALGEYERAAALAGDVLGEASNERRVIRLDAAHAAYLAGENERAECLAGDLTSLYRLHSWFEAYARALDAAAALSRASGDRALEEHVLESFADLAARRRLPRLDILVRLHRARRAGADGDLEAAGHLCAEALARARQQPPATPDGVRVLAPAWLETARLALAGARFDTAAEALAALQALQPAPRDGGIHLEAALLAACLAMRGRRYREAARHLARAVTQAERSGLRRPFLAHAPLIDELAELARLRPMNFDADVLRRARALAGPAPGADAPARRMPTPGGRLLLTERELDILHFLVDGLSSKEMARRLQIAEGTIKTHRKHLYEKLKAGLRSQAITRARELGLL